MCQGIFLLRDSCDGFPLIGNIYLVLGHEEAFSKKRNLRLWINHPKMTGYKKIHETTFFFHVWMRWICTSAAWKKHFDHSMRRERHFGCASRHAGAFHGFTGSGSCLIQSRSSLSRQHLWHRRSFHPLKCVLAKVSFSVISEWRQSRVL